ncbi:MAG TPA: NRDE family protein [Acidimicrobiales bacterium]|nr:NRDE family protein [Acidimicrobiales bacterium]
MCLLIVLSEVCPGYPLVVAANRDERTERPAVSMTVLQDRGPRILGGRDELAGGTWLAVNEHGLVAGLTNRPVSGGRDESKRSRGELPLRLARWRAADEAVDDLVANVDPGRYNPCWFLVADRRTVYYVDLAPEEGPPVRELGPGIHALENRPLGGPSPKVDYVTSRLEGVADLDPAFRRARLETLLADHTVPPGVEPPTAPEDPVEGEEAPAPIPVAVHACCVHTDGYGTRSSLLIEVEAAPAAPPALRSADGPPCTAPFVDVDELWG